MADQPSIFGTNTPVTPDQPGGGNTPNVQIDPAIANLLTEIKNERGEPKYKTLQDALVALKHSQEYIPQLTNTLKQKDEELNSLKGTVDKLSEIEKTVQLLTQKQNDAPTSAPVVNEETIAELVTRTLTKTQQEAVAKTNVTTVVEAMKAKFGAEADKVFYGKAEELGMSREDFNALAARTPKAVLKLVGLDMPASAQPSGAPNTNAVKTEGFTPRTDSKVGRNTTTVSIGATTQELHAERENAKAMVEELHAKGMSVHDLTDPKVYFKTFGKG